MVFKRGNQEQLPPPEPILGGKPQSSEVSDPSGEGEQIQPPEAEGFSETPQVLSKKERKEKRWKKRAERKRRRIGIGGSFKIEKKKGGQAEQESVEDGLEVGVEFRISKESPEPERFSEKVAEDIADKVAQEVQESSDFTEEEKKEFKVLKFIKGLKEKVKSNISKGALVDFVIGFGAGFGYKALVGSAVRTGVKRAVDLSAPGMGVVVGATTGASYEFIKTTIQEARRKKEEKQGFKEELEGKVGVERLEALLTARGEEGLEKLDEKSREIYEQLQKSKINWRKVGRATLRGAVVGGIGGAIGGAIADRFNWGGTHFGAGDSVKDSILPQNWAGNNSSIEGFAAAERVKDISAPMQGNVWNTVKLYLEHHGVNSPSNKVINEATRVITDANNIEITGDHLQLTAEQLSNLHHHVAGGIADIRMQQGTELGHFDKLKDIIKNAGGTISPEQVTTQPPSNLPGAGASSRFVEMKTSWVNSKNLYAILGVLGAGTAFEAGRRFRNVKKKKGNSREGSLSIFSGETTYLNEKKEAKIKPALEEIVLEEQEVIEPEVKAEAEKGAVEADPLSDKIVLETDENKSVEELIERFSEKFKKVISLLQETLARKDKSKRENLKSQALSLLGEIDVEVEAILNQEQRIFVQKELKVYLRQVMALDDKITAQDKEADSSVSNKDKEVAGEPPAVDKDFGDGGPGDEEEGIRRQSSSSVASASSKDDGGRTDNGESAVESVIPKTGKESSVVGSGAEGERENFGWLVELKAEGRKKFANQDTWALLMRKRDKGGPLWAAVDSEYIGEEDAIYLQKFLRSIENYRNASQGQINKLVAIFKVFIAEQATSAVDDLITKLKGLGGATRHAFNKAKTELTRKPVEPEVPKSEIEREEDESIHLL